MQLQGNSYIKGGGNVKIIIDSMECEAEKGEYILNVARRNGIDIPTLCNSAALSGLGSCRLCVVELIEGRRSKVVASCIYPLTREAEIRTDTPKITGIRKSIMKLLLSQAPGNQYLNKTAERYDLLPPVTAGHSEKVDNCILCGLCVKACEEIGVNAISTSGRGTGKRVATPYEEPSTVCIGCGACAAVCPTGAIEMEEKDGTRRIWGKTFELLRCESCGRYYEPRQYIEFIENKAGEKLQGHYCGSCRKANNAEKFKNIFDLL